jgi:cobalamin biosynthesis protein CobT
MVSKKTKAKKEEEINSLEEYEEYFSDDDLEDSLEEELEEEEEEEEEEEDEDEDEEKEKEEKIQQKRMELRQRQLVMNNKQNSNLSRNKRKAVRITRRKGGENHDDEEEERLNYTGRDMSTVISSVIEWLRAERKDKGEGLPQTVGDLEKAIQPFTILKRKLNVVPKVVLSILTKARILQFSSSSASRVVDIDRLKKKMPKILIQLQTPQTIELSIVFQQLMPWLVIKTLGLANSQNELPAGQHAQLEQVVKTWPPIPTNEEDMLKVIEVSCPPSLLLFLLVFSFNHLSFRE